MIAALFASLALATAAPSTPAPVAVWQNVTLGEDVGAVLARLGRPASRRKAIMGTYLLEYEALGGRATLSLTDAAGIITGIRIAASDPAQLRPPCVDPFGVALGDSADRLTEMRGLPQRYDDEGGGDFTSYYGRPSDVRWTYGLRDGVIVSIGVIGPYRVQRATGVAVSLPAPQPSNAPALPPPDATSFDRAVRVTPQDRDADPQFELDYVRRLGCGASDHWSPGGETQINARRRNFLRVDATCPSTGTLQAFYFDITAVFQYPL